jgi:putative transcriptional regulator
MRNGKKKDVTFDANEFMQAVGQVRDHVTGRRKITMRTVGVSVPQADKIGARQIRSIRTRLNVSQEVFARMLNVPIVTEASWEKGRRNPSGAALRLLQIARNKPEALLEAASGG